jgi:hypothetical protein
MHKILLGMTVLGLVGVGCSKKRSSSSAVSEILIPTISSPVSSSSYAASRFGSRVLAATGTATTGVSLSTSLCGGSMSACNSALSQVWSMTNAFLTASKTNDMYSCIVQAMHNNSVISGLGDGAYHYATGSDVGMKIKVTATGSSLENYEMFLCSSGTQVGYVSATLTGTTVAFSMKQVSSGMGFSISASGEYSDGAWLSKSMTFLADVLSTAKMKASITQYPAYVDIKGTSDTASSDFQFYSRTQLLGSTPATYALGDGSAKAAADGNELSGSPVSWLGDSPSSVLGTASSGAFYSDVSSGSYHALPLSDSVSFGTAETWDCVATDATDFETSLAGNTGFATDVQACQSSFE